jgi:hypothetical protein
MYLRSLFLQKINVNFFPRYIYVPSAVKWLIKLLSRRLKSWFTITTFCIYYPHSSPHVISKEMLLVSIRGHRQSTFETFIHFIMKLSLRKGLVHSTWLAVPAPIHILSVRIVFGAETNTVRSLLYIITNANIILTM